MIDVVHLRRWDPDAKRWAPRTVCGRKSLSLRMAREGRETERLEQVTCEQCLRLEAVEAVHSE